MTTSEAVNNHPLKNEKKKYKNVCFAYSKYRRTYTHINKNTHDSFSQKHEEARDLIKLNYQKKKKRKPIFLYSIFNKTLK